MATGSRVATTVTALVERIAAGEFAPGERLPGQDDLARLLGVSRLTVREAVKELQSGHIVRVEHGNGTFVTEVATWTDLDAIARVTSGGHGLATALALVEVRRMIEVGAAELAAARRDEADLAAMHRHLEAQARATEDGDVPAAVEHDLGFHAALLQACHNPFVAAVLEPLGTSLATVRARTSAVPPVRSRALEHHRRVLAAVEAGDRTAAARAMSEHMDQTAHDLATVVVAHHA